MIPFPGGDPSKDAYLERRVLLPIQTPLGIRKWAQFYICFPQPMELSIPGK